MRKFKVGDKIRVVKGNEKCTWFDNKCCEGYIGKIGKIEKIEKDGKILARDFVGTMPGSAGCGGFTGDCLELVKGGG